MSRGVEADVDAGSGAALDDVLARRDIRTVFQPLVHLASGEVVGYEALSRGPAASALESPAALFDAAALNGRVGELDWVCRASALRAALGADPGGGLTWFVNIEPAALATPCPPDLVAIVEAAGRLRVVTELTEREVDRDPARLLAAAARARHAGWGVALDDVGAVPGSLALLPFLQPDVVKLDLSLVQGRDADETAAIATAVRAHVEETGAAVLAEGIEHPDHLRLAQVLGATHGQGWHLGRPGRLPERLVAPSAPLPLVQQPLDDGDATPFELVSAERATAVSTKGLLLPMSLHLESQAAGGRSMVLLSTFQSHRNLTPATARRYRELARRNVLVAAVGAGLPELVPVGVRGVDLADSDRLTREWSVIAVGPHYAGALVGQDLGDTGADAERRFAYAITHDRPLVLRAARSLLRRITT